MGAEEFGREIKRYTGAGGRFIKQQRNAFAVQKRTRLAGMHLARQLEDGSNLGRAEVFQVKKRAGAGHAAYDIRSTSSTCSSLSTSVSLTSMISRSVVCTVRPMKAASMGNSRCPRSIKTQSCTRLGRP